MVDMIVGVSTPILKTPWLAAYVSVAGAILLCENPVSLYALAMLLFVALFAPYNAAPFAAGKATSWGRRPSLPLRTFDSDQEKV